jgi:hypothetical protein
MNSDTKNNSLIDSSTPSEGDIEKCFVNLVKQAFEKSMVRDESLAKRLLTIPVVLDEVQVYEPAKPGPRDPSIDKPEA